MESDFSQDPVDRLIRELIRTRREATAEEVDEIVERMATVPFNDEDRRTPGKARGTYLGQRIGGASRLTLRAFTAPGL